MHSFAMQQATFPIKENKDWTECCMFVSFIVTTATDSFFYFFSRTLRADMVTPCYKKGWVYFCHIKGLLGYTSYQVLLISSNDPLLFFKDRKDI